MILLKKWARLVMMMIVIFLMSTNCKSELDRKQKQEHKLLLFDFEDLAQTQFIKPQDATYELVGNEGNSHVNVVTGTTLREAGVRLLSPEHEPWDLSSYFQVKADITNLGEEIIQVELFVGNDPDDMKRWYCSDYVDLAPGESKTISVDLAWTPWIFEPQIEVKGLRGIPGQLKADLTKITELTFCSRYATEPNNFTIDNVRAVGKYEKRNPRNFFPFVDEYGQYIHDDWKGKIHSDEELEDKAKGELEYLSKATGPKDRGKFGGWTAGPKLKGTGFFRTEKKDGKWWIVDPEGYLFWTAGLNCVASDAVPTGVSSRENYFLNLPEKDGEFHQFYGQGINASHGFYKDKYPYETYNFYQSNLYRKYGEDWLSTFQDLAHKRIKNWGMNTIGFVSDFGATRQARTPYVGSIWIYETPKIEGSEGFWGKFHDVFDPTFRYAVRNSIEIQKEGANDPYCIGYFVDNELSWGLLGSLSISTLKSPASQSAKIEFVNDLKAKYSQIENLNAVWGTSHKTWEALLQSTTPPNQKKANEDLVEFYGKIADTYFKTINEELKKIAPHQNYLGCRFAWANNDVVLSQASKYLDIMSFNKYEYSIENFSLPKGVDMPVMIGEFHFGALDRGSFHIGIKKAKDQAERGQMYQDYIQGALRHPNIVGAHWFQYIDEPNTGRFDGENYNVGFLDICDNPYEELIAKVKETTYSMYDYRINTTTDEKQ
ncbi:beta-galactosidase [Gelidibacter salicanalis]|uniref:Beta-galactosidase n=1 Tax=Gelidibacter salicanalis TaxID=291193 RepID=A0A934KMR9_9FLAO|nr:beta-galactosidase [Gelidibacter salicanalis]MBJ7880134.1 beta-galactosidase [Gelidibacter salicanalis]